MLQPLENYSALYAVGCKIQGGSQEMAVIVG